MEPCWLRVARGDLGLAEIAGKNDAPFLRRWQAQLGVPWLGPSPWCGVAVAHWLRECDVAAPRAFYRARAWLDWGHVMPVPAVGSVVVFERTGGGHVGFVVGRTYSGNLAVVGGNQGDRVSIASFPRERVLGYRWPNEAIGSISYDALPVVNVAASGGEA